MEKWQGDFEWQQIRHFVKERMGKESLPDLNSILLLIGIQEANVLKSSFSKEEKQDLMHVATCHLLSQKGYFEFVGNDDDGWPHYKQVQLFPVREAGAQATLLKESIIQYFEIYKDLMIKNED